MIDFRYHLVSIVSIFLALAVGIVLGAGPLKEDIGNTLTSQVTKLRDDKAALRSQLDATSKAVQARDDFTEASNKTLLSGRLPETTVALVVLPGADANLVKQTAQTLTASGATIGAQVTVLDAWTDPDKATFRSTLAEQLAASVQAPVDTQGTELVDVVLARALLTKAGGHGDGAATALEGLRTGELIRYTPDRPRMSSAAVIVSGQVGGDTADQRDATAAALGALSSALGQAGQGAVLVGATPDGTTPPPTTIVSSVRKDADQAKELSTVDDAAIPMGQASIVFALLEQLSGKSGHYGLDADATAAFPPLGTK